MLNRAGFLKHLGVVDDIGGITLTTQDKTGKKVKLNIKAAPWDLAYVSIYKENAPKTRPYMTGRIYEFFEINPEVLFIRINAADYDFDYPPYEFTKDIETDIEKNKYAKVMVDMRDNGGGNFYYMIPTIQMLKEQKEKHSFELYTLIGESTFSSGVINSAQLQRDAGAVLVGAPTKGNVYFYGETSQYWLSNSNLSVTVTLNYTENIVPGYSQAPLQPDIMVKHTALDYISGTDADVEAVLKE